MAILFLSVFHQPRLAVFYQTDRIKLPLNYHNGNTDPPHKKRHLKHVLTTLALLSGLATLPAYIQTSSGETSTSPSIPHSWSIQEDADQDGMKDDDEILLGMDPLDPADGLADLDGDGISLAWEFTIGTNPDMADTTLYVRQCSK